MFGIDMGPSKDEKQQFGNLTSASGFATDTGEKDINASSDFMRSILSGDSTKIAQALAPQIGAAKVAAQNQEKTTAATGTRSGGTAAVTAATNDKIHSDITALIGQLTGSSVSGLASTGSNLLSTGISGDNAAFGEAKTMQEQREAQINDLFKSITSVAAAPFTGGASLTGVAGGGGTPFSMPSWLKAPPSNPYTSNFGNPYGEGG